MALQKQSLFLPFAINLDTKTDPFQLSVGNMLSISNVTYTSDKRLEKRNGFGLLGTLPANSNVTTLTTFNGNLVAIGDSIYSLSGKNWITKDRYQSLNLDAYPVSRSSGSQTAVDLVKSNNLFCHVYADSISGYSYVVSNSATGETVVGPVVLPTTSTQARVFVLGRYFIVTFLRTVAATPNLSYIAIPISTPASPNAPVNISAQVDSLTAGYDAYFANDFLYLAWQGSDVGGAIRLAGIDANLNALGTVAVPGFEPDLISMSVDYTGNTLPVLWVSFFTNSSQTLYSSAYDLALNTVLAPTVMEVVSEDVLRLTSYADNLLNTVFYEIEGVYPATVIATNRVKSKPILQNGSSGAPTDLKNGVGLASKAFTINSRLYILIAYQGTYEPTYFIIDSGGFVLGRIASTNGGGYPTTQVLSNVTVEDDVAFLGYLFKSTLVPVNKSQDVDSVGGVFSVTGANALRLDFSYTNVSTVEIGGSLHIAGGMLWQFDGTTVCEQGFHLYPEDIRVTTSGAGGNLSAQQYYYSVTYEWTDAAGNINRSAPSIAVGQVTVGATSTNTLKIPTLRITNKPGVRIVIYRWSTAQQTFYQITSISSPTLNNPTVNEITYVDTQADASIIGNPVLYTTGGVVENLPGPASNSLCLFKSRLFLISAEDKNRLWYSKQVIESTPVEMSDLFTLYVAPTTGVQASTGPLRSQGAMDDKLILNKSTAFYYLTGQGPDNTGANNDFTDATFITAVIGCENQPSIAFTPQGLIFQTNKGLWSLGRDLSTNYIGAPVEAYNDMMVSSSVVPPATNEARFTLTDNVTLVYDFYYQRWCTYNNPPALSSTLYQSRHTYLDKYGRVLQETPGQYLDVSNPVLMSLQTGWMNLAGVEGLQRAYFVQLLGEFLSPHKLNISLAYDYNASPSQSVTIVPDNYSPNYGSANAYGQLSPYGGPARLEQYRVFFNQQKCQAFQFTISETFDATYETVPGAGLTLSGLNFTVGIKKPYTTTSAAKSVG